MSARISSATAAAPFIGRTDLKERIAMGLQAARDGRPLFLLFVGDEGVGKSSVLRYAADEARRAGFQVLQGHATATNEPRPFGLVQSMWKSLEAERAALVHQWEQDSTPLPILLAPLVGDAPPGTTPRHPLRREGPDEDTARLLNALTGPTERGAVGQVQIIDQTIGFIKGLQRNGPLYIGLDDLHLADSASLDLLRELTRSTDPQSLLVVAASVPESKMLSETRRAIESLLEGASVHKLVLSPFSSDEAAEFIRHLAKGRHVPAETMARWYSETEGNPLFLELISHGGTGDRDAAPPGTSEGALEAQIRGLSDVDQRILSYGAVMGREFEFPTLLAASGMDEEPVAESLERLIRDGFVRERGEEFYEFVREPLRAVAYGLLTESRRRILHRKVAHAIEGREPRPPSAAFELARQYYLARDEPKALQYNRQAAELAARAYAYGAAAIHLERAIESAERQGHAERLTGLRLRIELGRVLGESGELRRSIHVLEDAVQRARKEAGNSADLATALLTLARARVDLWEHASAQTLATEAYEILQRLESRRGLQVAHRVLGVARWCAGDYVGAERHHREAGRLAEEGGDEWARGHALIDIANALVYAGKSRAEEAVKLYSEGVEIFARLHDETGTSRAYMNRGVLQHSLGHTHEALSDMRFASDAAERSGSRLWIVYTSLNEAQYRAEANDPMAAQRALDRVRRLNVALGDALVDQQAEMIEGLIRETAGKLKEAEEAYVRALDLARKLELRPDIAEMQWRLAELAVKRGETNEARRRLQEALDADILNVRADLAPRLDDLRRQIEAQ